ncbi:MAG: hypothetical protein VYE35_12410, partial [Chloroflexota bacterium]|nr:hypothetical protein [Chloroflexota bacterium]
RSHQPGPGTPSKVSSDYRPGSSGIRLRSMGQWIDYSHCLCPNLGQYLNGDFIKACPIKHRPLAIGLVHFTGFPAQ